MEPKFQDDFFSETDVQAFAVLRSFWLDTTMEWKPVCPCNAKKPPNLRFRYKKLLDCFVHRLASGACTGHRVVGSKVFMDGSAQGSSCVHVRPNKVSVNSTGTEKTAPRYISISIGCGSYSGCSQNACDSGCSLYSSVQCICKNNSEKPHLVTSLRPSCRTQGLRLSTHTNEHRRAIDCTCLQGRAGIPTGFQTSLSVVSVDFSLWLHDQVAGLPGSTAQSHI